MMDGATAACRNDLLIGRRASTRHKLDMSARLITAHDNVRVQLEDVSSTGACIKLMHPRRLVAGRLCWLQFDSYARVVWQSELRCGVEFAEPLSDECLRQTVEFGELMVKDASDKYVRLASAWVHGPGDW